MRLVVCGHRLDVDFIRPPIPIRDSDYSCTCALTYDGPGSAIGWGSTRDEAMADYFVKVDEGLDVEDPDVTRLTCPLEVARERLIDTRAE